jgi:hypothetical protein
MGWGGGKRERRREGGERKKKRGRNTKPEKEREFSRSKSIAMRSREATHLLPRERRVDNNKKNSDDLPPSKGWGQISTENSEKGGRKKKKKSATTMMTVRAQQGVRITHTHTDIHIHDCPLRTCRRCAVLYTSIRDVAPGLSCSFCLLLR